MAALLTALLGIAIGGVLNAVADFLSRSARHGYSNSRPCRRSEARAPPGAVASGLRHRAITPRRLLIPAITGALFGYIGEQHGLTAQGAIVATLSSILLLIAVVDLRHHLIPNVIVFPGIGLTIALSTLQPGLGILQSLYGALLGFGALLIVYLAARGRIGEGDVKLAGLLGAISGASLVLPTLALSFAGAGVTAIALVIFRVKTLKDVMPLGPYLAAGGVAALLWGGGILSLYARPP